MDVAVIGAGLSGVAVLRLLADKDGVRDLVAYEPRAAVGGLWVYTEKADDSTDGLGIQGTMYRDCQANETMEMLHFPDFNFPNPPKPGSFLTQWDVKQYINDYVDHFNIRKHIQLNTLVERVHPETQSDGKTKWEVRIRRTDGTTSTRHFDAVFVCNGNNTVRSVPDIPGLSTFEGRVIHSGEFRTPEIFTNQTVVVMGGGPSATDITCVISKEAKHVYLCHNSPLIKPFSVFPDNVTTKTLVKAIKPKSVVLQNGEEVDTDAILLCTGYKYSFPFLSDACRPSVQGGRVFPLYKHAVHVDYPTLLFISIQKLSSAFKSNFMQAQFAVGVLLGKIQLPDRQAMLDDIDEDHQFRRSMGLKVHHAHNMYPGMVLWKRHHDLLQGLTKGSNCITHLPDAMVRHYDHEIALMFLNPKSYRSGKYPLDTNWDEVPNHMLLY